MPSAACVRIVPRLWNHPKKKNNQNLKRNWAIGRLIGLKGWFLEETQFLPLAHEA